MVDADFDLRVVRVAVANGEGSDMRLFRPERDAPGTGLYFTEPFSFAIEPRDPGEPVDVMVTGYRCDPSMGDCPPSMRHERARVSANETRVLWITLLDACAGVTCGPGQTCDVGPACVNVPLWLPDQLQLVPPGGSELEVGPPDAGPPMDAPGFDTPDVAAPVDAPEEPDAPEDVPFAPDAPTDAPTDVPDPPDAPDSPTGYRSCADLYDAFPGFVLCEQTADSCRFLTSSECETACFAITGESPACWESFGLCTRDTLADCGLAGSKLCECARVR